MPRLDDHTILACRTLPSPTNRALPATPLLAMTRLTPPAQRCDAIHTMPCLPCRASPSRIALPCLPSLP